MLQRTVADIPLSATAAKPFRTRGISRRLILCVVCHYRACVTCLRVVHHRHRRWNRGWHTRLALLQ